MAKNKAIELEKNKIDTVVTTTRPDLEITFKPVGLPGSFIIKDGKPVPNLKDDAVMKSETDRIKNIQPKPDENLE